MNRQDQRYGKLIALISVLGIMAAIGYFVWQGGIEDSSPLATTSMIANGALDQAEQTAKQLNGGSYVDYKPGIIADTPGQKVLFFHASWCPTCKILNRNIENGSIPKDLTIIKVDYDSETELKRQYGVTYQHTLVEVDDSGNMIKKWNGSPNIDAIVDELS